jgi:hypothetical protein
MLRTNSEFFNMALSNRWREGEEKNVHLPEDDPNVFDAYLNWLYTHRVVTCTATNDDGSNKTKGKESRFKPLMRLYVLGEKLMDAYFQNILIDHIVSSIRQTNTYPNIFDVGILYAGTPKGSSARELMVDLYVCNAGPKWSITRHDLVPNPEFLHELVRAWICDRKKGLMAGNEVLELVPKAYYKVA